MSRSILVSSVVAVGLMIVPVAQAVPISYGNLSGDNVVYQQITEDSSTDPTPLYGTPGISGDSLVFSPVSFGANAGNGTFDITDGTLTTTIQSLNDYRIEQIQFSERGDYTLAPAGIGTSATSASVAASLFVRVDGVDGGSWTPISQSFNLAFNPSDGTYNLIDDPGMAVNWDGGILVDVDAMIANAGSTAKATKVSITLDNQLLAFSEPGTVAYIKKKQAEGITITTIPEPATLSLLLLGGLFLRRR